LVTDVPEPGTYTLMPTGLGIMGLLASGKKRQGSRLLFETQHSLDMASLRQRFHSFAAPTATPLFLRAVFPHVLRAAAFAAPNAARA